MKNKFTKLSLVLVITIFMGVLASGCGTETQKPESTTTAATTAAATTAAPASSAAPEEQKPDTSKPVTLTMYLSGSGAPGAEAVYSKLSEMAKTDINATVEVSFLTNTDAYNLMLSSGEEFDIAVSTNWMNYADNARKGAFKEITDEMLQKYISDYLKEPKAIINSGKVNGKLYSLPEANLIYNNRYYVVRGDLMKKYNIQDIKTLDDFGNYLDAVKKNEKNIIPLNLGKWDSWQIAAINFGINDMMAPGAPNCTSPIFISKTDDTLKLQNTYENPEVIAFCKKMKEWANKGFWAKDALSNPIGLQDSFMNGKSAACTTNVNGIDSLYVKLTKDHPEWDVRFYNAFYKGYVDGYSAMTGGMSIGAKSKNPERALMLLNLMMYDQKYYDLTQYGIEGVNYTVTAGGQVSFAVDNTFPFDQASPWITNDDFVKPIDGSIPTMEAQFLKDSEARFKANPTVDFALDTKDISDISTNISNLYLQYGMPLYLGFVDDVDKAIATYRQKLEEAGLAKYTEVTKAQLEEYMKNNK